MKGLRVLIITYDWMPRNAVSVHRPYTWAKYWSARGVEVTVLTAKKYTFDQPLDLHLPELEKVQVIEVPYFNEALTATNNSLLSGVSRRLLSVLKGLKGFLGKQYGIVFDVRDRWVNSAIKYASEIDVDIVVSTCPPKASHLIAAELKKLNPKLCWIADYRDLWSQNHLIDYSVKTQNREKRQELMTVGTYADAAVTVSDELAKELAGLLKKDVKVIMNGFDLSLESLSDLLSKRLNKLSSNPIRIAYTGMIYKGRRDPTPLFEAIRQLHLEGEVTPSNLIVEFYGSKLGNLQELVEHSQVGEYIRIIGHVSREKVVEIQREVDFALMLESGAPDAKGVLTGKLFEYIGAAVPIISLGSVEGSAISNVLDDCGCGVAVGSDVDLLKDILLVALRGESPTFFKPDLQQMIKYSREVQAEEMLGLCTEALEQTK